MSKKALITGITGQDGSYLAELLLSKGYEVHGLIRRSLSERMGRIEHVRDDIQFHVGDMTDQNSIDRIVKEIKPDELYNLAAMSFVPQSWDTPSLVADVDALGVVRVLNAVRLHSPSTKVYQASSSEMFGNVRESPQNEETKFSPRSLYGTAKVFGHNAVTNFRESYDLYCVSGILFNHESPRRGKEFVTRKITSAVARIAKTKTGVLKLGNLDAKRDWGFAGDYVKAMWMMLQNPIPQDFVIATGVRHSVGDFLEAACLEAGMDWKDWVECHGQFIRPAEVNSLQGDASLAKRIMGWEPTVTFEELVSMMVKSDMEALI